MRRKLILVLCLTPALMANQCFNVLEVRVQPGPSIGDPPTFTFRYGRDDVGSLKALRVSDCSDHRNEAWAIERGTLPSPPNGPLRITYGRPPAGYREEATARELAPGGCYHVIADGGSELAGLFRSGVETIRVLPNGRLAVGEPGGLLNSSRPYRDTNRAAVGCARGYRRARTAADSAAVDAREFRIVDARVTCRWMWDTWPDLMTDPIATEQGVLWGSVLVATFVGLGLIADQIPEPEP